MANEDGMPMKHSSSSSELFDSANSGAADAKSVMRDLRRTIEEAMARSGAVGDMPDLRKVLVRARRAPVAPADQPIGC
jgi:hypothetical protein